MTVFKWISIVLLFGSQNILSQEVLTLDQAINLGLSQNQDIGLARLNADIFGSQVYRANAGMSPTVDWNVNAGGSVNSVNQLFFDDRKINRIGRAVSPNTNVTLNWNIFDGGQKRDRYKLLKSEAMAQVAQIEIIEDQVKALVREQYTMILRQRSLVGFLSANLKYYIDRLNIVTQRWELGKIAKLDVLQSQNDLKTQENLLQIAKSQLIDLKSALNITLERDPMIDFEVEDLVSPMTIYTMESVMEMIKQRDGNLRKFDHEITNEELNRSILDGSRLPRVGVQTGVGYSLSNTNAGLILLNQNLGVNALFTASWTLFDGGHKRRQVQINTMQIDMIKRRKMAYLSSVKGRAAVAMNKYNLALAIKKSYQENLGFAKENLDIILEKLKLGGASILEVNDAQQRFDLASQTLLNIEYDILAAHHSIEALID
jgi:outer membrane protein